MANKPKLTLANEAAEALGLKSETVQTRTGPVEVREFSAMQVPELLRIIQDAFDAGQKLVQWDGPDGPLSYTKFDFAQALLSSGNNALRLVTLTTDLDEAGLNRLSIADLLAIYRAIYSVNADFLTELTAMVPAIQAALSSALGSVSLTAPPASNPPEETKGSPSPGPASSSSSPAPDSV